MFSIERSHGARTGHTLAFVCRGGAAAARRTSMGRVIVAHASVAPSRVNFACQVPAAGEATSADQK